MDRFSRDTFRHMIVGLMLLLALAANLVPFSYDADVADDIPPVTIELQLAHAASVAELATAMPMQAATASVRLSPRITATLQQDQAVFPTSRHPLLIPLLC
jgi:hypothetical protein